MDKKAVIHLQTRKFFCDNSNCETRVFTERFESLIKAYVRKTDGLAKHLEFLGFAVNAKVESVLSKHILVDVSSDNMLRLVKQTEPAMNTDYQCVGVDYSAIRKGHKYCTLICDLVTRCPVGVLPDRNYKDVRMVKTVSRDKIHINGQISYL